MEQCSADVVLLGIYYIHFALTSYRNKWKAQKREILTRAWSTKHTNAGQNIQKTEMEIDKEADREPDTNSKFKA